MAHRLSVVCALALCAVPAALAGPCQWTDPDSGATFDLTPAVRSKGSSYVLTKDADIYIANLCEDVDAQCDKEGESPGIAFQFRSGQCIARLAASSSPEFSLLDANNPDAGIKVKYSGGDPCEAIGNQPRSIVYNLHCDADATETSITGETEGTADQVCHYSLDWKSPVACPTSSGSSFGASLVFYGVIAFAVYAVAGTAYGMKVQGKAGLDAFPHLEFWREVPAYVKDGFSFTASKMASLTGRGESNNPYEAI